MPIKKLTDLFCERVKEPDTYSDASFPGLQFRLRDDGGKSFSVVYRIHRRQRRFTLGSYPALKPADARSKAQAALDLVRRGIDPAEEKRARRDERLPGADTFGADFDEYLEKQVKPNTRESTYLEIKRAVNHDASKWRKRPTGSINPRDAVDLIDEILERGARVQANRTPVYLGTFFRWCVQKKRIAASPFGELELPTKEKPRDRVLLDDELRWLEVACDELGWPFGPLFKVLERSAQRRDEVAGMRWAEVAGSTWTIPSERTKNGVRHEVHLSPTAVAILQALPRIGEAGLVFTTNGDTPVSGFSRAKRRLDEFMLGAKRRECGDQCEPIPAWCLHDLRRTAVTRMARLKIPPHVVDKILNHSSGTVSGVAAIYNRFEYLEERRDALELWGRYLDNLVAPQPANIAQLKAAR